MNCMVHGVTKSQTRLSNFHFTSYVSTELIYFIVQQKLAQHFQAIILQLKK